MCNVCTSVHVLHLCWPPYSWFPVPVVLFLTYCFYLSRVFAIILCWRVLKIIMCGSAFSLSSLSPAIFDVTPKVITRHLHYTALRTQSLYHCICSQKLSSWWLCWRRLIFDGFCVTDTFEKELRMNIHKPTHASSDNHLHRRKNSMTSLSSLTQRPQPSIFPKDLRWVTVASRSLCLFLA